ncbi:MAG TPA: hypothetical protein VFA98_01185 [Thermoanaerobaculia bacterium]|nr:hypothetical protein [Thermoanaerobaculia bacterium]
MKKSLASGLLALLLAAAPALAYVVKLKDGSLIFAKTKYTVKGDKAIITLENGTVTQMRLDLIDVDGSEKYNKENFGNVVAIDTPDGRKPTPAPDMPQPARLQDYMKNKKPRMALPSQTDKAGGGTGPSFQEVDPNLQSAFAKVFDGAGISQYKLTNFRGKTGLLVTTNTEEAVFNALNAAARALSDPQSRGLAITIHIILTTSGGEAAGTLEMSPEQARQLVNGQVSAADYFVKNVAL